MQDEFFNDFIEVYKNKSFTEKKDVLIYELKEMLGLFEKLCIDKNIPFDVPFNREIVDINKCKGTEEDFVEAVYVYLQMIKEAISQYILYSHLQENDD